MKNFTSMFVILANIFKLISFTYFIQLVNEWSLIRLCLFSIRQFEQQLNGCYVRHCFSKTNMAAVNPKGK